LIKITLTLAKRYADHIIVVNEGFVNYLLKFGLNKERITVIMNVPPKSSGRIHKAFENKNKFSIFYYGNIELDRGVLNLIKAVKDLKNVELLLAGRGKLVPLVKNIQRKYPNIKYIGWLSTSEIKRIIKQVDLVPSLYTPDNINNILASPNKLFTCMSEGIPVFVPKGSYQAVIVKRYNCGLAVDMNNIPEIKNVILELFSSPDKYLALGSNGIKAINSALNWQLMEKNLIDLYKMLED
jgi:glycosyltransferase involved in cell wall biosynthesis